MVIYCNYLVIISAITKTTVDVKLTSSPTTAPTTNDFTVTVAGTAVPVTAVTAKTGTTDTFTLSVSLDGKEGNVSVNGVASAAFDYAAPTAAIQSTDATHINVVYSEKVDETSAESLANYTADKGLTITAAVLQKDGVTVKLTTSAQSAAVTYKFNVNNVVDLSGNAIAAKDYLVAGTESPVVLSAYSNTDIANKVNITGNGYVTFADAINATGLNLVFNTNIDASTVNSTNVKLQDVTTGDYIPVTLTASTKEIKIVPLASSMVTGHKYIITTLAVKSSSGFVLGQTNNISFIIGDAISHTAVASAIAVDTLDTSSKAAVGTTVSVVFPATMDQSTVVASGAIKLQKVDSLGNVVSTVAGTVTYDSQMRKATFKPAAALDADSNYLVTVAQSVEKISGIGMDDDATATFTTATLTKPVVYTAKIATKDDGTSVDLVNGMTGVTLNGDATSAAPLSDAGANADIKLTFTTPSGVTLDSTTVKANQTVFLLNETTGEYLPITVDLLAGNKSIAVYYDSTDNTAKLTAGNKYKLTLSGIKDNSANTNILNDVNYEFTAETAAPVVTGYYTDTVLAANAITSGVTNLNAAKDFNVKFSKNVAKATVANVVLYDLTANTQSNLTAPGSDSDTIVVPNAKFTNDHKYKLVLPTTLTDVDGHALDAKQEFTFTVGDAPALTEGAGVTSITYVKADASTPSIKLDGSIADVTQASAFKATFTEKLDATSINATNISLKETVSGTVVPATFGLSSNGLTVAITPNSSLKNNTSYTLSLSGVKDVVGNVFSGTKSYVFKTEDTAANAVASSVTEASTVNYGSKIVLTFSKDSSSASAAGNISLKKVNADGTLDTTDLITSAGSLNYNSATKQLTIDLSATDVAAAYGTNYRLTLDKTAFGLGTSDYTLNFATAKDTVAPSVAKLTVNSVTVKSGDTNVADNKALTISFNDKDLAINGVDTNYVAPTVKLYDLDSQTYVNTSDWVVAIVDGTTAADTLTIDENTHDHIANGGHYRLTITGAEDKESNVMTPYSIDFTAGTGVTMTDNSAVGYVSETPGTTDKNVAIDSAVAGVTFDKEVDTRTVTSDTAYLLNTTTNAKVAANITFSGANHDVTLTPVADLDYNTTYKAVFTTGIKNVAGNIATAEEDITFTTVKDTTNYTYVDAANTKVYKAAAAANEALTDGATLTVDNTDYLVVAFTDAITKTGSTVTLQDVTPGATTQPVILDGGITVVAGGAANEGLQINPVGSTLTSGHVYKLTISGLTSADGAKTIQAPIVYTFGVN